MKQLTVIILVLAAIFSCQPVKKEQQNMKNINNEVITAVTKKLLAQHEEEFKFRIERGVNQTANLWIGADGNAQEFEEFCIQNFIVNPEKLEVTFNKLLRNFEILAGRFHQISIALLEPLHLDIGEIDDIDYIFGSYLANSHLMEDLYKNKIAFIVSLNFPYYTLKEKNELGANWTRKEWAYARLGDLFTSRVPAELMQFFSEVMTDADTYISDYNIFAGQLLNDKEEKIFPAEMKLLSHWNLRDEIKSNYADNSNGLEKQRMIYRVMERIIDQTIPQKVINNNEYEWNPFSNITKLNGQEVTLERESDTRYQHILNYFAAFLKEDKYYPNADTYIKRAFEDGMEISSEDVENLFIEYVSVPLAKQVGELISKRLNRKLETFDIWYDGFKARSSMDQNLLDNITTKRFPNTQAFQNDIPNMLKTLGFSNDRAIYLADKIVIDPARGSGHAIGAEMKGDVAHLRTRIGKQGMDYKGYNIAIHELGHNVEQTISLYDVDYYVLKGVPNTAFTEALAFMLQKRDLDILKIQAKDNEQKYLTTLDLFWGMYEIMGVSLVDMNIWKWLYNNPNANAEQLKQAVLSISKEVWNKYYAPVFGIEDQTVLAIYSHIIASPLYLPAYPYGNLIEFQLEKYIENKNFANEVQRVFELGRLTPETWMRQAVGNSINLESVFLATQEAIDNIK